MEAYGSISRRTVSYARAAEGLTRVDLALYDAALRIGDTKRAKQLIDEVVKYNPNNRLAQEKLLATNRAIANPNDTSILGNVAITPGFVSRVNQVQQLFIEAEQFRRTGQWDEAEGRLKHILAIDPHNIAATKQLERINAEKDQYAETARIETRDERLRQVEEKWAEPINNREVAAAAQESQPDLTRSTSFGVEQTLNRVFLSLDFSNASIEEATNFLSIESKRLDPNHKGINFIIQPEASTHAKGGHALAESRSAGGGPPLRLPAGQRQIQGPGLRDLHRAFQPKHGRPDQPHLQRAAQFRRSSLRKRRGRIERQRHQQQLGPPASGQSQFGSRQQQ